MIRNLPLLFLLCISMSARAQYSETFSTPDKGYKLSCANDLTTVNWSLTPWDASGTCQVADLRDPSDYFSTTAAGVLESIDLDQEVCWESPLINTAAAPTVSLHVFLDWAGFDTDVAGGGCLGDYIKVMYSVNGGAYTMVPNQVGGNACATIAYPFGAAGAPFTSSTTVNQAGIAGGSTLKIRVCVFTNANAEVVKIDNVSVPEAGVTVGCAAPVLTTALTPVGCNGPNTGAVNLSVSAGTPPYTYDWSNDGPENPDNDTQDLSGIPVGTYTVTVSDAGSCSATTSVTIVNDPAITLSSQVLDATCSGSLDGEIDLIVSGGFAPYTYDWSNDGPENPDNDAQDLVGINPGTYTVTVTDAVTCTKTISVTVGTMSSGAYLEQFNTPNKGYLLNFIDDFSAVNWSMSSWVQDQGGSAGREMDDFFNTSGGVLTGVDFDSEVCWISPVIDLNSGTQFSMALTWTGFDNEDYINVKYSIDGGAFVTMTNVFGGGVGTIQYPFPTVDQNGSITVTKTGLSGNTLQIQVCGLTNSQSEVITIDNVSVPSSGGTFCPGPEASIVATNVTCNGAANGSLDLTVTGGSAPYTYLWSFNNLTTQDISNLGPGTYTVTVTDANALTVTASAAITQPSAILLTSTQVNVLCNGASTGSIDLTASGGVPGYTYDWSNDGPESPDNDPQDLSGLAAGIYTVTVTDATGCTKTTSVTITSPPALVLTTTQTNVSCNGGSNGSIDLTVVGGNSPYNYNWGAGQPTTQDRTGLTAGTYCVTVTDANNCTKTTCVTISQPSVLTLGTTQVNVSCNGASDGSIDLSVSGGTPGYTFSWGAGQPTTEDRTGLAAGTYCVTVTDGNGCTKTTCVTITQPGVLVVSVLPVNILCNGASTGSIDLSVGGGTQAYTYDWSNDGPESPDNDPQDLSGLPAGTYTVTVTDANGCTNTTSVTLTEPAGMILSSTVVNPTNCNIANGSIDLTVTGGAPGYTYDWSNDGPESPDNDPQDLLNFAVGTYTVTVTDANGCTAVHTQTLNYTDNVPPAITCPADVTIAANGTCAGTLGTYSPVSVSDNCNANPTVTQSPASGTALSGHNDARTVTLTANDGNGNTNFCTFTVTLKDVTKPTITCPANVTIAANASCGGAVGAYSPVSVSDNCNPSPTVTQSPASGTALNGHNDFKTVTLTANDGNGNTEVCTFTVTLKDVTKPSITCPANVTIAANANCGGAVGSYAPLSVSDNCNPSPTVTQSPASGTALNGHNDFKTVTLTANDGNGNTEVCTFTVTLKDVTKPSITCPANVTIAANASCSGAVGSYAPVSVSDNCNPSPTVTQSPASGTALNGHNDFKTVTLTANDGNGNTEVCTFTVTLKDVTKPSITCPANVTIAANASCGGVVGSYAPTSVSDNCNPSPAVTQSPAPSTTLNGHNDFKTVTLTANDGNGNTEVCTFTVTLKDVTKPTITCPANVTIAANANCGGAVGSYAPLSVSDNCNPSPTVTQSPASGTALNGHNDFKTVTLTANDGNGNTEVCTFTVTLKDVTKPSITCPANVTIAANASCGGAVGSYAPLSVSDNCNPSPTVTQSPASGTALNGHNDFKTVTLTANDGNGNTEVCTFTVTLKDVTKPTITCPANVTIAANASCGGVVGSYAPTSVSDNCNPSPAVTQSPAPSTTLNGHNDFKTVTLTANDGNGNTEVCTFTVTLKDVTKPTITCPANVTIAANASCGGVVGSYAPVSVADNCNPSPTVTQSPAPSTTLSGHNDAKTVTLTANDGNGNSEFCTFTVTLKDVTKPSITCPSNTTVAADANCSSAIGSYTALSVSDNCTASPAVIQSPASSTLINGSNPSQLVTLTATDNAGNNQSCTFTVSIVDQIAPSITCPANATVSASATCSGTVGAWSAVSVSDNCTANPAVTQSPASGTTLSGHNDFRTVTLTATDASNNTKTCTFTVTLKDVTKPVITCPGNVTVAANASCGGVVGAYSAVSASDNCTANPAVTQSPASSTTLTGHNDFKVVTLTATDGAGNTQTCTFSVTLKDVTAPTVVCKPATVNLNAAGTGSITMAAVYQSGTDNCGTVNQVSVTPNTFTCSNLGANTVTLNVNDGNGNTASCTATVTVVDPIAPTMLCKPATISLNAQGQATLTPAQVNNGSFDNCTLSLLTVTPSLFTCAQLGPNTVELGGLDQSGNKASCFTTVTVVDPIIPTALCKNLMVNLGANGSVSVAATQINNGSSDNCSFTLTLTPNTFTCANIGANTVTLRATDTGGNSATCTAVVTVKDASAPVALCKNPMIFLNNVGQATLTFNDVNNGSSDNCGISTVTMSQTQFNCSELAGSPWAVTVTLKDAYNNTSTCISYVTVKDAIAPTAVCENTTVHLGQNGIVTVYPATLADNSTDNCAVWSYSPVAKTYTAANLGNNNLTITVKDWSNNAATCVAVVTVLPFDGNLVQDEEDRNEAVQSEEFNVRLYPNPTAGDAMLEFGLPTTQDYRLMMYDLSGRVVLCRDGQGIEGWNSIPLAMGTVAPGVYLLELRSNQMKAIKRLIVQE